MNVHRAPSLVSRAQPAVVALLVLLVVFAGASPLAAQQRVRAIVLSFEGWHAEQARTAVVDALGTRYELITEEQAINTAAQIAVDVSTPEGMASVVQHLRIELVVGGSVAGTGRRSSTTIFVLDRNGNQIGDGTAPGPTGRAAAAPIGEAALAACDNAMNTLHPPQRVQEPILVPEPATEPEPEPEQPPMRSLDDIENERPGSSRGQGGGDRGHDRDRDYDGPSAPNEGRWNQPVFRGLLQLDFRNRSAWVEPDDVNSPIPTNYADFYPQWGVEFELRPFANNDDALRGLYARVASWFSLGINYYSQLDADPLPLQVFGIEANIGYAGTIAEAVELIGTVGFGYDSYSLTLANTIHEEDMPSVAYPYLPIMGGGRVRLLPSSVTGVDLHLEAMVGPRIVFGGGQLAGTGISDDSETALYYSDRRGGTCPRSDGVCNGDFGLVSGAALNVYGGLGLTIDPGFSAAVRVQYTNYFLGFADGMGTRRAIAGSDESFHIQIMAGWALR